MEAQPRTFGNKAAQQRDAGTLLRSPDLEPQGFTSVPNWLKDVRGLSHHGKLAFVYLLQYSWQDGQCFPGLDTLASDLEVERHSASRYLKELEVAGLIRIERRGQGLTNVYHLLAWRPSDGLDGTNSYHQDEQEGTETCHQGNQDGTEMYHLDGTGMHHLDGTKPCHNKDSATKTQITTTGTPVDMSTKVDDSARLARAREGSEPIPLHPEEHAIDPIEPWLPKMVEDIHKHWRGRATKEDKKGWAAELWEQLKDSTPREREAFLSYLFDGPYLSERSNVSAVGTTIRQDAERWKLRNKPSGKSRSRSSAGPSAPKVPAHIQREHDLAYKPKTRHIDANSSPEEIDRILAKLRKYEGEESAQKWLRSIMAEREGA